MKILGIEGSFIGIGVTANQISGATVVRLVNTSENSGTVQVLENDAEYNDWGAVIGSITIPSGEVVYIQKKAEQWLSGDNYIKYAKVAYSHMMSFASYGSSGGGGSSGLVTDGLVLHLDPDDSSSYSGSGTAWNNLVSSGGASNGTLLNGVSYTAQSGSDGGYFRFDGSNDYVDFGNFNFGTAVTLFCFARPENRSSIRTLFSNAGAGGKDDGVHFYLNQWNTSNNKMIVEYGNGSVGSWLNSSNTITNDSWQALTFTYDKSNNKTIVYNNTTQWGVDTNASIDSQLTAGFKIGRFEEISNYYYRGRIGIYLLYNRELTSSEVSQLYNHYKSRYGL